MTSPESLPNVPEHLQLRAIFPPPNSELLEGQHIVDPDYRVRDILSKVAGVISTPCDTRPGSEEKSGRVETPIGILRHFSVTFSDYAWLGSAEHLETLSFEMSDESASITLQQEMPDQLLNFGPFTTSLSISLHNEGRKLLFTTAFDHTHGMRDWTVTSRRSDHEPEAILPTEHETQQAVEVYEQFMGTIAPYLREA